MPLIATRGAASAQGFGEFAQSAAATYIEDVFSTYLYTGNGSTQTITNGIDLSGKGGLTWMKSRSGALQNFLIDTTAQLVLYSNSTAAGGAGYYPTYFNPQSNGFYIDESAGWYVNTSGYTFASWTFRKQPKFFDVVTFTSDGSGGATINHSLGSAPGCVIVKSTGTTGNWFVYHRSIDPAEYLYLNTTDASMYGGRTVTTSSTTVTYPSGYFANSTAYVAYLFAHNAGGFGSSNSDNVISCGSFNNGTRVELGYEPQWIMCKSASASGQWWMLDNMRSMSLTNSATLQANTSNAENNWGSSLLKPDATGFTPTGFGEGNPYIYIAIRRGPMKTPTTGTSVFSPNTQTGAGTSAGQTITTNFPVDLEISSGRANNSGGNYFIDRLRGGQNYMRSNNTNAEVTFTSWTPLIGFANNTGITDANYGSTSGSYVAWNFRRAPGFFDEVCYTGTGASGGYSGASFSHNLQVIPELIIVKSRASGNWKTMAALNGSASPNLQFGMDLNGTGVGYFDNSGAYQTYTTSTTFTPWLVGAGIPDTNVSGDTYVAYLFASCPGVSKVGSYTGTGATQTIDCGFTGGARFVLIKRIDSTGDWYVWDSARGIVAGNDPYLLLNSTANEVTNTDYVDTYSAGFEISSTAPAAINASGGSFIFLAIA